MDEFYSIKMSQFLKENRMKMLQYEHYEMFNKAVRENRHLKKCLQKYHEKKEKFENACIELKKKLMEMKPSTTISWKRKAWSQIKCEHTKTKHIEEKEKFENACIELKKKLMEMKPSTTISQKRKAWSQIKCEHTRESIFRSMEIKC